MKRATRRVDAEKVAPSGPSEACLAVLLGLGRCQEMILPVGAQVELTARRQREHPRHRRVDFEDAAGRAGRWLRLDSGGCEGAALGRKGRRVHECQSVR